MEIKYDGNACSLQYKNGELVKAVSRGDGVQGEGTISFYCFMTSLLVLI